MLSFAMIQKGFVIQIEWAFLMIVIVSLIVNKINTKLTCLAYVIAIVYVLDWFLVRAGLKIEAFKINYIQMISLVGILHVIEGILTFFLGGKSSDPVMAYRGEEVAGGYRAYARWLVPLLFFSVNGIYVPIMAMIIYCNESFVVSPKEKAKKMGILIGGFGLIVMAMATLVERGDISLGVGILSMPLLHEFLFMIDTYIEEGPLKYPLPHEGIRIMEILGTHELGINRGDIIKKINDEKILEEEDYHRYIKTSQKITVEIEKLEGEVIREVCTSDELRAAKLIFLPPC